MIGKVSQNGCIGTPLAVCGNGCVGQISSPGTSVVVGTAISTIGIDRLAGVAMPRVQVAVLAAGCDALDRPAAHVHVEEDRTSDQIEVPHLVVNGLVVPGQLAGLQMQRDDRVREQVLTLPRGAVVVG